MQTSALRPAPWQHLEEDRDGLHTTAELLQVRVQSLTYILSVQEEELARKVGPSPPCGRALLRAPLPAHTPLLSVAPVTWAAQRETKMQLPPLLPRSHTTASPRPQVQPSDSLEPEFSRKSQALLKHWREKVFALMVQLKAQELEHGACVQQLKGQVTWCSSSPWLSLFPLHKGWHLVNQCY